VNIRWTANAVENLTSARRYAAVENEKATDDLLLKILDGVRQLEGFPDCGREGRVRNTRELVIASTLYIVAYRIKRTTIQILAILHGRRRWPMSF
jgi:toxin ParE1/3/4